MVSAWPPWHPPALFSTLLDDSCEFLASLVVGYEVATRGDADRHLDEAEIRAKFARYSSPVVGAERATAIERAVDTIGVDGPLRPLFSLLLRG